MTEALDDRASFRRFCGLLANEATPERTAFARYRQLLIAHQLDRSLFQTVTTQLKSKAVTVKTGTLVDAAIIASASKDDDDARWVLAGLVPRSQAPISVVLDLIAPLTLSRGRELAPLPDINRRAAHHQLE